MRRRIAIGASLCVASIALGRQATAINLEYKVHVPGYSVGFEHILIVDPAPGTLIDDGGDPSFISDFNFWRPAPPSLGTLKADTSISSDVPAANLGPTDEFHVFSPTGGGLFKIEGMNAPGGFYDGEASTFSAVGIGSGPGIALVKVSGGSEKLRSFGILGLAVGIPVGLAGTAMYSYGKYDDRDGLALAGGIVLGAGAVMILAAIPMLISSTTTVRDAKGSFIAGTPDAGETN